ncbi:hypothetical protein GmHk_18G051911 [Glycine max]|nr:hypothetical protein GmHk_18G051911 [Glycine max]
MSRNFTDRLKMGAKYLEVVKRGSHPNNGWSPDEIRVLDITSIKELGRLMGPLQMQAFHKAYGKILDLAIGEISTEAISSLTQYYDQPLRCFTFGDFQLVPTVEEFQEILGCPLGGRNRIFSPGSFPP